VELLRKIGAIEHGGTSACARGALTRLDQKALGSGDLAMEVTGTERGAAINQTRRCGIRVRPHGPFRARDLVFGEALCYFTLALTRALLIVVVGTVMFLVSWGNPLTAAALSGLWALVGTGRAWPAAHACADPSR
jgi:hypothetical protein